MATYKPLTIVAGQLQQIQAGNTLVAHDGTESSLFASTSPLHGLAGLSTFGIVANTTAGNATTVILTGTANQVTVTNGDGIAGSPTFAIAANPIIPGNSFIQIPAGVTSLEPSLSAEGMIRYDTSVHEITYYNGTAWQAVSTTSGTVSSVDVALPTSVFSGSSGAITSSGTITFTLNSQTANTVFAAPNGVSGVPSFRALTSADIPAINVTATGNGGVTGVLAPAHGGTGVNNGTSTITVAGNVTVTGANTLTLSTTAATSVTLPVSGTLLSTDNLSGGALAHTVQGWDAGLDALATFVDGTGTGLMVQTGVHTFTDVSLTAPSRGFTITNSNGVLGSPTFVLANNLAALEGLTGSPGFIVLTSDGTMSLESITGSAGRVVVTNGTGAGGTSPTVDLATVTNAGSTTLQNVTIDTYGRVSGSTATSQSDLTSIIGTHYLPETGGNMTGNIVFNGTAYITGLPAVQPNDATSAASKAYVDAATASLNIHKAVETLTSSLVADTQFNTATYAAGTTDASGGTGIGAKLTGSANAVIGTVGGYANLAAHDRVLVDCFTGTASTGGVTDVSNGIYVVTKTGMASAHTVSSITASTKTFVVSAANVTTDFAPGVTFTITGTTGGTDDGTYTVASSSFATDTSIVVVETVAANSTAGTVSAEPWVLTRSTDYDDATAGQVHAGDFIFVTEGTYASTGWVESAVGTGLNDNTIIGTNPITFTQFSGAGAYTADSSTGLSLVGTTFKIVQGAGITTNPTNELGINLYGGNSAASGALWFTNDGSTWSDTAGSKLYLKSGAGLTQDATGLYVGAGQITNSMISTPTITLDVDNSGTGSITLGGTLSILGNSTQGISTSITSSAITVTAADASSSQKGVASFGTNFTVTAGNVVLATGGVSNADLANSTISYTGNTGGAQTVALGTNVNITGSGAITTVSSAGNLVVSVAAATTSSLGVASFNSADFTVTGGAVSLNSGRASTVSSLTDTGLTPDSFIYSGIGGLLSSTAAPSNGQLLIGSSGTAPVLGSITGTANRLAVTNGAGTIALDIDAAYVGQASITTLGTVTTGTWHGTAVDVAHGGTGLTAVTTGGILIGSSTTTVSNLAAGAAGQVLTVVSGSPAWVTPTTSAFDYAPTNGHGSTITIGQPVYVKADGTVDLALATTATTNSTMVVGLVADASVTTGSAGNVAIEGLVTSADWTTTTGAVNLVVGATYYLSDTTVGRLTTTAPTAAGSYVAIVGIALNATTLKIKISPVILL